MQVDLIAISVRKCNKYFKTKQKKMLLYCYRFITIAYYVKAIYNNNAGIRSDNTASSFPKIYTEAGKIQDISHEKVFLYNIIIIIIQLQVQTY